MKQIQIFRQTVGVVLLLLVAEFAFCTETNFSTFKLSSGDSLSATGGLYLSMQRDGNLVLRKDGQSLWASGSVNSKCQRDNSCSATFQSDGNLVVRRNSKKIWHTQTYGNSGARLIISDQSPHIKIVASDGKTLFGKCLSEGTDATINSLLEAGGENAEVVLCPRTVIKLSDTILFTDKGQKIYTDGYPVGADRATLLVTGKNQATAISAQCGKCSGVQLRNLIVDGNRHPEKPGGLRQIFKGEALIKMGGSVKDHVVDHVKSVRPRGFSALLVAAGRNYTCKNATITNNDIGPSGESVDGKWADGISIGCQDSLVSNNIITDATDGGIVVFGASGTKVLGNTIITKHAYLLGGINAVDYISPKPQNYNSYVNTVISNNTIHAQGGHIRVGIAVGPSVWFGERDGNFVEGGTITRNILTGNHMGFGLVVNGVKNFTITGNKETEIKHTQKTMGGCDPGTPLPAPFLINYARATGKFQPEFRQASGLGFVICTPR